MSLTVVAAHAMLCSRVFFLRNPCCFFSFDFQVRGDGDAHDAEMRAARWIAMFHVASHVTLACAAVSFFPR